MNLLLDTNILLWWMADSPRLPDSTLPLIGSPDNSVLYSAASIWEIAIKQGLGKLDVPEDLTAWLASEVFLPLPVTVAHALEVRVLPPIHRDPFDRILVAQCLAENLTLVTSDGLLAGYPAQVIVV